MSAKRLKLTEHDETEPAMTRDVQDAEIEDLSEEEQSDSEGNEDDTDDELAASADRPAKKRRRALSPTSFGASLTQLLSAPAPTSQQVAQLRRPAKEALAAEQLDKQALRLVQSQKKERQERCHVKDIIGGWGPRPSKPFSEWQHGDEADLDAKTSAEVEKDLRRLAQKGTVKLFNAIRQAQHVDEQATAPIASLRKTIKADGTTDAEKSLPEGGVQTERHNILGSKGREQALSNLSRASFLEILKSGGLKKA